MILELQNDSGTLLVQTKSTIRALQKRFDEVSSKDMIFFHFIFHFKKFNATGIKITSPSCCIFALVALHSTKLLFVVEYLTTWYKLSFYYLTPDRFRLRCVLDESQFSIGKTYLTWHLSVVYNSLRFDKCVRSNIFNRGQPLNILRVIYKNTYAFYAVV